MNLYTIGVDFGKDTMVLGEFGGKCTQDDLCVVPKDVFIFVKDFEFEIKIP